MAVTVQLAARSAGLPQAHRLKRFALAALEAGNEELEVCLRVVGEHEGQTLNDRYRGRDYATNVLSFTGEPDAGILGDIVLCAPVVEREARAQGKTAEAHWAHMVVHGVLHLQGFDHQIPEEAEIMEARERSVLARLGFEDPYRELETEHQSR